MKGFYRRIPLAAMALGGLVLAALPWVLFWDSLPAELPSHYGFDGRPDQWMSRTGLATTTLVFTGIGAIPLLVLALLPARWQARLAPLRGPSIAGVAGMVLGIGVEMSLSTVITARGAIDGRAVSSGGLDLVLLLAMGFGFAAVAAWLVRGSGDGEESVSAPHTAREPLKPGESAVWVGSATQPRWWLASLGMASLGLIPWAAGTPMASIVFVALALPVGVVFARIRVQADQTGVTVRYTPLRWPSTHIDLADIRQARAIDVHPSRWGGWGYRGTLRIAGVAAVVTRRGPGLRLDLTRNRTFVVTVDRPEGAAELITAELDRGPQPQTNAATKPIA